MHLAYGKTSGNATAAQALYAERFPARQVPGRGIFERLHRQLRETGAFQVNMGSTGRPRSTRTVEIEEVVLQAVEENPHTSTRAIARRSGIDQSSVWRTLHEDQQYPYHIQPVQGLTPEDYPKRVQFCRWFLRSAEQPDFPAHVLFTDEATFTREGIFNTQNARNWAHANQQATRPRADQNRFTVNVWAGIVNDYLLGPHLLPTTLDGRKYLDFLQRILPELLRGVPDAVRNRMWFQHDGAPAHYHNDVRNYLNATLGNRWIGRGGPIEWPARSPDLTSLDFFLWGYMKQLVYETPVNSREDLAARIDVAAVKIRETPGVFENVRQSMLRRCQACITTGGRNFEHFL